MAQEPDITVIIAGRSEEKATQALMAEGTPIIYQAQLKDETEQFVGYPMHLDNREDEFWNNLWKNQK